ncbi:hypothetical protein GCM10011613_17530 [Cellvibrio zantedeschiae]|uniref:DUF8082 domain-containing protein n=1 Tax=Cellvibrio zantedeschiae TaxID=1237077 RepID=A0ABQ3B0G2_9GAMM|nr:hypothetical protein [Cellvibrio zantedeschiae]GGY72996.1 hypothetical protein GCM10011613_17530 [Cellvibrio zantedeschiae]
MVDHSGLKKLSPAARQLVLQLNDLFAEFVGPIGQDISQDVFDQWLASGKFGPAAIRHYALALGEQLDANSERQVFLQKAEKLLLQ